ncbi:hypothetical protein [Acidocella sp.]|jgi:hypothetical protein|uniref:hypothetical protein n=1 Tax=Acidocella sp. TaxID=50710 RepID=UPI002F42304B
MAWLVPLCKLELYRAGVFLTKRYFFGNRAPAWAGITGGRLLTQTADTLTGAASQGFDCTCIRPAILDRKKRRKNFYDAGPEAVSATTPVAQEQKEFFASFCLQKEAFPFATLAAS